MEIGLDDTSPSALLAGEILRKLNDDDLFCIERGLRHPLGIYNVSISRITERATALSDELYDFFSRFRSIRDSDSGKALKQVEDRLEMFAYALAEHVDDCETLLKAFFRTDFDYAKSKPIRQFKDRIRGPRRNTSFVANAIKHNHQRIRFFESEFHFAHDTILLLGFFLEKFSNGTIGPDQDFLGPGKKVASCVSFLWSSLLAIIEISHLLRETLLHLRMTETNSEHAWNDIEFRKSIISVGRLPLYIFDDENPFAKLSLKIIISEGVATQSGLIGSFYRPSKQCIPLGPGAYSLEYVGDGVTKSFNLALPTRAAFLDVQGRQSK